MVGSDVFPYWRIAIDAAVSAVVSFLVLWLLRWRSKTPSMRGIGEDVMAAGIVGFSVLAWRSFANAPELNGDTVPGVSPADALSPIVAYVCLGALAAFRPPDDASRWARACAILALVVFVVNVVVI